MKKTVSIFLFLLLLHGVSAAFASNERTTDDYSYELQEDGTAKILNYKGSRSEIEVPSQLDGHPVTAIGKGAFSFCNDLVSVIIPEGVKSVGNEAFYHCANLYSVSIPASVSNIGEDSLNCPKLEIIIVSDNNPIYKATRGVLFDNVKKLLVCCPPGLATQQYSVPEGTLVIGKHAFYDCEEILEIRIPDSVIEIQESATFSCERLTAIRVSPENPVFADIGGVLFEKANRTLISYPPNKDGEMYSIPQGIVSVGLDAFIGCNILREIQIPDSVEFIEAGSLFIDSLTAIRVAPENPVYADIGGVLFDKTQKMLHTYPNNRPGDAYDVPHGVRVIGNFAFCLNSSLVSVTLPDSLMNIGEGAFGYCDKLNHLSLPSSVTAIDDLAFWFSFDLVLNVEEGSYAEEYAIENDLEYINR